MGGGARQSGGDRAEITSCKHSTRLLLHRSPLLLPLPLAALAFSGLWFGGGGLGRGGGAGVGCGTADADAAVLEGLGDDERGGGAVFEFCGVSVARSACK
jgi:hypothetical protein